MSFLAFLAILSNTTRVMSIQPFHESQVVLICGKVTPGFLGFSWHRSSQLLQPLCEWQDIFGNSWLSWLFLLFLLWSNSRLSLKAKSYLLALQAFLGIPLQAFQESQEFPCFSAFSRLLRGKKVWKSQESRELRAFLGSPGFSGLFYVIISQW